MQVSRKSWNNWLLVLGVTALAMPQGGGYAIAGLFFLFAVYFIHDSFC